MIKCDNDVMLILKAMFESRKNYPMNKHIDALKIYPSLLEMNDKQFEIAIEKITNSRVSIKDIYCDKLKINIDDFKATLIEGAVKNEDGSWLIAYGDLFVPLMMIIKHDLDFQIENYYRKIKKLMKNIR